MMQPCNVTDCLRKWRMHVDLYQWGNTMDGSTSSNGINSSWSKIRRRGGSNAPTNERAHPWVIKLHEWIVTHTPSCSQSVCLVLLSGENPHYTLTTVRGEIYDARNFIRTLYQKNLPNFHHFQTNLL